MPLDNVSPVTGVLESTVMVTLPVGVVVPVTAATAMVKVTGVFTCGAVFDAAIEVVVSIKTGVVLLAGQAVARLNRSSEPNPLASSYPVVAEKPGVPLQ